MKRIIRGDEDPAEFLTDWMGKLYCIQPAQVDAIIAAGITDGAPPIVWPQAWVDAIPLVPGSPKPPARPKAPAH